MKSRVLKLLCVFCMMIFLVGCQEKSNNEEIKIKVSKEIDYLDIKIVSMLNLLNNISVQDYLITTEEISLGKEATSGESENSSEKKSKSMQMSGQDKSEEKNNVSITQMESQNILESDENKIDWKTIKNEIETINEAWAVVILDLTSLNIDNNNILTFSSILDESILSIKNEDKQTSLSNLARLYEILPKLEKEIEIENVNINIKKIKSNIINAYSRIEKDEWTEIEKSIVEADENFKTLTNDTEYIKNKEYKINRTYILLKELQNSLEYRDKKLFYVKYKNLIESINSL